MVELWKRIAPYMKVATLCLYTWYCCWALLHAISHFSAIFSRYQSKAAVLSWWVKMVVSSSKWVFLSTTCEGGEGVWMCELQEGYEINGGSPTHLLLSTGFLQHEFRNGWLLVCFPTVLDLQRVWGTFWLIEDNIHKPFKTFFVYPCQRLL